MKQVSGDRDEVVLSDSSAYANNIAGSPAATPDVRDGHFKRE